MYSRPTKSTSSVYAISLGIFSSNVDLGSPITVRNSFRAFLRYMVKSRGLSPSPWGVPTLLVKGAFISALFILVLMCVLLNKNCMSLSSSFSTMFFRIFAGGYLYLWCQMMQAIQIHSKKDESKIKCFLFSFDEVSNNCKNFIYKCN